MPFADRLKHAWNAFRNKDPTGYTSIGTPFSGYRPDRGRLMRKNERSIITSIYNRIATDSAAIKIRHVRLDENGRYLEDIKSGLNNCLSLEANIDQTGRNFVQDLVMSMLDEGCTVAVPVDTEIDPEKSESVKILSMRTGKVLDWYPKHVRVQVYNEITGQREEIILPKSVMTERLIILPKPKRLLSRS